VEEEVIRPVLTLPDPHLSEVCAPVLGTDNVTDLITDLFDTAATLTELDGKQVVCAGLAAPQIGVLQRVFILALNGMQLAFVNPEIRRRQGRPTYEVESCFSEPGAKVSIARFPEVMVRCTNWDALRNFRGFAARVVQHEIDHLNGVTISSKRGRA
jgi:peptide deformylase